MPIDSIPPILKSTLEAALGPVIEAKTVGGGDISQAAQMRLADDGQLLVKWRSGAPTGLFTAERRGLELLRSAEALRIPTVLAQSEATDDCPAFIALEWLGQGAGGAEVDEALGHGLARLHGTTGPTFGLDHDNFIGANPQPNRPSENWATFFQEQRVGSQMELAARQGRLPTQRARRLERLIAQLDNWLPPTPPASLLHGDLWGGNWLVTDSGQPALIDPAVYYGHREADIAFTELFGGFSKTFYAAYNHTWPLEGDYQERKDLYNLYHLLNHLNLFGEGYGGSVDAILSRFVG